MVVVRRLEPRSSEERRWRRFLKAFQVAGGVGAWLGHQGSPGPSEHSRWEGGGAPGAGGAGGAGMNTRGRAVVCLADSEAILEVVSYRMSRSELCSGRQRVKLVDLAGGLEKS